MKQTIFETRQRADELMREAINIWRQSAQSDFLEGLEDDPVMSLIMTALAYQMKETVSEYEHMKAEVLEEYAQLLTPYEIGHATPATAVVEGVLQDIKGYFEHKTNGKVVVKYDDFTLKDHEFGFKLYVEKTSSCKKQMWSEVSSAVVNVVNFMFSMDNSTIDVSICAENGKLEVEVVSKW